MKVSDLIAFLQTQPQDIQVAYSLYSEQCLLGIADIVIKDFCAPRDDGWVENKRPDKPTQPYLLFPGN
jgi:hypothetical protein